MGLGDGFEHSVNLKVPDNCVERLGYERRIRDNPMTCFYNGDRGVKVICKPFGDDKPCCATTYDDEVKSFIWAIDCWLSEGSPYSASYQATSRLFMLGRAIW